MDDLLQYYDDELRFMRELSGEFAEAYPKIASRLRISKEAVADPHVERLIEAFAFMNARTAKKLDDMFPELTSALLGLLYPHIVEPTPSAFVAELKPDEGLDGKVNVQRGQIFDTQPVEGASCTFTSCYDVEIAPYKLSDIRVFQRPLPASLSECAPEAVSALRFRLSSLSEDKTFDKIRPERVRFFIAAETRLANKIYEWITNNVTKVVLSTGERDANPVILSPDVVRPVGFSEDETLLPVEKGSSHLYSLLSDYFAFPEKYHFFDVVGLDGKILRDVSAQLDIQFCFDALPEGFDRILSADNFRLFSTPMVNTFYSTAEPVRVDYKNSEQRIVPNARRESTVEVQRVVDVSLTSGDGEKIPCQPFYSIGREASEDARFWQAHRRKSPYKGGGDDVYISFSLPDLAEKIDANEIAELKLLCTNRNLCSKLPFGGGQPNLFPRDAVDGLFSVDCLTPPSGILRSGDDRDREWRFVAQLSLNHLSLTGGEQGAAALREILSIHDRTNTTQARTTVEKLVSVVSEPATARIPGGGRMGFCSGMDVTLAIDDERFSGSGVYLLVSVLDRFFAAYCAINSFSRLKVSLWNNRETLKKFPARSGAIAII